MSRQSEPKIVFSDVLGDEHKENAYHWKTVSLSCVKCDNGVFFRLPTKAYLRNLRLNYKTCKEKTNAVNSGRFVSWISSNWIIQRIPFDYLLFLEALKGNAVSTELSIPFFQDRETTFKSAYERIQIHSANPIDENVELLVDCCESNEEFNFCIKDICDIQCLTEKFTREKPAVNLCFTGSTNYLVFHIKNQTEKKPFLTLRFIVDESKECYIKADHDALAVANVPGWYILPLTIGQNTRELILSNRFSHKDAFNFGPLSCSTMLSFDGVHEELQVDLYCNKLERVKYDLQAKLLLED